MLQILSGLFQYNHYKQPDIYLLAYSQLAMPSMLYIRAQSSLFWEVCTLAVSLVGSKPYIIPSRPDSLIRLNTLLGANEPDIDQIVKEIRENVALYSSVMAIANSPAFSGSQQINALEQAIMRVGLIRLKMIIQLVELKNSLSKAGSLERFWDTASEVAEIASYLTRKLCNANGDDAYTLGMIHDCGVPLMIESFSDYKQFLKKVNGANLHSLYEMETERYDCDHFAIGGLIAEKWSMGSNIADAIRLQPNYLDAVAGNTQADEKTVTLLCNLLLAKEISKVYRKYWRIDDRSPLCFQIRPVLDFLGISEVDYADIRDDLMDDLESR